MSDALTKDKVRHTVSTDPLYDGYDWVPEARFVVAPGPDPTEPTTEEAIAARVAIQSIQEQLRRNVGNISGESTLLPNHINVDRARNALIASGFIQGYFKRGQTVRFGTMGVEELPNGRLAIPIGRIANLTSKPDLFS